MTIVFLIDPAILPPSAADDSESCSDAFESWRSEARSLTQLCEALGTFGEPTDRYELWQIIVAEWASKCEPTFPVTLIHGEAVSTMDYPISRARNEPSLDLEHMSSEEDRMLKDESFDGEW